MVEVLWEFNRSFHTVTYLSKIVIEWLSLYIYIYVCVCVYIYTHTHTHTHTHISDCTETVYELTLLPNNTAVKHFYTNRSGAK